MRHIALSLTSAALVVAGTHLCQVPLDIVLVQDVTSDLDPTLKHIAETGISELSKYITSHSQRFGKSRLGLVTFQDKPIWPLGDAHDHCAKIGAKLTENFDEVAGVYKTLQSAGGVDIYENQFGALLATALTKKLDWGQGVKLVVLVTDSAPHFQHDGRSEVTATLRSYNGTFDDENWDKHCLEEDYPSAEHVKEALETAGAYTAFLVSDSTHDRLPTRAYEWFNGFLQQPRDFVVPAGKNAELFAHGLKSVIERVYESQCSEGGQEEEKPENENESPPVDPELRKCFTQRPKLEVHFPGSAEYVLGNIPLDLYFGLPRPAAIVLPRSTEDVSFTVRCANENNKNVIARSGGHDYAVYSYGQYNDLIIDLRYISTVEVEKDTGYARVGAGVRLGPLYYQAFHSGGYMIPAGACTSVGAGGHISGGGYGYFTRNLGLGADYVVGAEIVLANGTIVYAKPDVEATKDLFWAINGAGGGSVGIITYFDFHMVKAPPVMTASSWVTTTGHQNFERVVKAMVEFAPSIPKELSMSMTYDSLATGIQMAYFGKKEDMKKALEPVRKLLGQPPLVELYREGSFLIVAAELSIRDINDVHDPVGLPPVANFSIADADTPPPGQQLLPVPFKVSSVGEMNTTADYMPPKVYFKEHSVTWTTSVPLTSECVEMMANAMKTIPLTFGIAVELIGGNASQLAVPRPQSSFNLRDMQFISHLYARSRTPIPKADIEFLDNIWEKIKTCASDKVYINYRDRDLGQDHKDPVTGVISGNAKDALEAYHTPLYNELKAVVKKYNPHGQFWFPQAFNVQS